MLASRPTMRPVASIITHFFSMSAGLAEKVFMAHDFPWTGRVRVSAGAHTPAARPGSTPVWIYFPVRSARYLNGSILPFNSSLFLRWDRIGRGDVGDRRLLAVRANGHFAGDQPFAELQQPRLGVEVAPRRLAQKIDVEIDGDRERHRSDRAEHRHVHGEIGERHHGRARNRAAGADGVLAEHLANPAAAFPHRFDRKPAVGMEDL